MHVNDLLNDQRPLLAGSQDFPLDKFTFRGFSQKHPIPALSLTT